MDLTTKKTTNEESADTTILSLPPELMIKILSFMTDFKTIKDLRLTSKRIKSLIDRFQSIIYFKISSNLGYLTSHGFSSSKAIYPKSLKNNHGKNTGGEGELKIYGEEFDDEDERDLDELLRIAKLNQKTLLKPIFEDVNDWKSFAQVKDRIDHCWRSGRSSFDPALMVSQPFSPVWRWKFDPEFEIWYMTSSRGGLTVVSSLNPPTLPSHSNHQQYRCWHSSNSQVYSHVESSGPYLITTNSRNQFLVWKRQDDSFESECPFRTTETGFEFRDLTEANSDRVVGWETFNCSPMFKLVSSLDMPQPAYCFKARAPFLAAGSLPGQKIFVWNLVDGAIVEEYDVSERPSMGMFYIELDSSFIFLGGSHSVSVYSRENKTALYEIADSTLSWVPNLTGPNEWVAVHHDVRGGHLLALSRNGWLFWTPRYKKLVSGRIRNFEEPDYVLMNLGRNGAEGNNLCVENDRAVISLVSGRVGRAPLEMLLLLNLRDWIDLEDFKRDPPKLIVLFKVIPSFQLTTRIEMDSCGVYISLVEIGFDRSKPIFKVWETLNDGYLLYGSSYVSISGYQWLDSSGQVLCEKQSLIDPYGESIKKVEEEEGEEHEEESRAEEGEPLIQEEEVVKYKVETKDNSKLKKQRVISKNRWLKALQSWGEYHSEWNENLEECLTGILRIKFFDDDGSMDFGRICVFP